MYYKLRISETASNSPKQDKNLFNNFSKSFQTIEDLKKELVDRYGKIPKGKNKIMVDTNQGVKEVGFLHSFWNRDISHNSKNWHQTDWIEISEVTEKAIKI